MVRTTAVVLAGGSSHRMGRDKRDLRLFPESSTLLERAISIGRVVADGVVVIGAGCAASADDGIGLLPDRWPGQGPLGGLVTAFEAFPEARLVVLASDYPMLQVASVARLLTELNGSDGAVAVEEGGRWHPLVAAYDARRCAGVAGRLFESGGRSMMALLDRLSLRFVVFGGTGVLGDADQISLSNVNSVEELEALRRASRAVDGRAR